MSFSLRQLLLLQSMGSVVPGLWWVWRTDFGECGARILVGVVHRLWWCGARTLMGVAHGLWWVWCTDFGGVVHGLRWLWHMGSVVAERMLSCSVACGIFPGQGLNPCMPCVDRESLNHWTTREVPDDILVQQFLEIIFSQLIFIHSLKYLIG